MSDSFETLFNKLVRMQQARERKKERKKKIVQDGQVTTKCPTCGAEFKRGGLYAIGVDYRMTTDLKGPKEGDFGFGPCGHWWQRVEAGYEPYEPTVKQRERIKRKVFGSPVFFIESREWKMWNRKTSRFDVLKSRPRSKYPDKW